MATFTPELLLGDELEYEACIRGLPFEGIKVNLLRKNLRDALRDEVPIDLRNLSKLNLRKEVQVCCGKFYEIRSTSKNVAEEFEPTNTLRATQRTEHLIRRVNNLSNWPEKVEITGDLQNFIDGASMELPNCLRIIRRQSDKFGEEANKEALRKLSDSQEQADITPEEFDTEVVQEGEMFPPVFITESISSAPVTTDPRYLSVTEKTPLPAAEPGHSFTSPMVSLSQTETIPVYSVASSTTHTFVPSLINPLSTIRTMFPPMNTNTMSYSGSRGDVTQHTNCLTGPILSNLNLMSTAKPTLTQSQPSNIFGKITNPIERYLNDIPSTDGLHIPKLLDFIRIMLKLKSQFQVADNQILDLLSCFARNPLQSRILSCMQQHLDVQQVHQHLINCFIPIGAYEHLRRDYIHRPQRHNENLAYYVSDVKEYAGLLRVPYSEGQLVEIIILGIHPNDRAKLVFHPKPNTFDKLDEICVYAQNVGYGDYQRNLQRGTAHGTPKQPVRGVHSIFRPQDAGGAPQQLTQPPQMTRRAPETSDIGNPNSLRSINCFKCGRRGHQSRDCRICYNCGKGGHFARECRLPPKERSQKNF